MKISVVTPSIRPGACDMVERCLKRQTLKDFEWLVCSPYNPPRSAIWIPEPDKRRGDFYNLNKCWNLMFGQARGELILSVVDLIWFAPDTLERFWNHYEYGPERACIGAVGNQYRKVIDNKPEDLVWRDPRIRSDYGAFYEINPNDLELCLASIPRQAILDVGGVDEKFDKYAALSEKEMMARLDKLGYTFWLDQSLEYRAVQHKRLHGKWLWDKKYFAGCDYYRQCLAGLQDGTRSPKLDNIKSGVSIDTTGLI